MIHALANHLWQSTLFALAVAFLTLAFRRNCAGIRYALWLSASIKFLVPFALLMSLGSHWHWTSSADRIASRVVAPQALPFTVVEIARPFSAAPAPQANYAPFFLGVWAAGFLLVVLLRFRGWLAIRAAVHSSTALPIPAAIEVRSSPALLEPGVVGFLRPILLLPAGIVDRLTAAQLEAVLGHELSHVRRRDNLTSLLHMIVEALFWFHALVWWVGARLVEERERACDEAVLTLGSQPRDYADAILNVCRLYAESPLVCVAGVTGANLKRRIEAIMTNRTAQRLNHAKKLLLGVAAAAVLAGPILIGVGHAPIIHAQPASIPIAAAPVPDLPSPSPSPAAVPAPPQAAPAPQQDPPYRDPRLVVIFFDFSGVTTDEQSRARLTALHTVHTDSNSLFAILAADGDDIKVIQDFTSDQAALASAIDNVPPSSATTASSHFAHLSAVVRFLESLHGKKSVIYFTTANWRASEENRTDVQNLIAAAQHASVAFYSVQVTPGILATYEGRPEVSTALVEALNREGQTAAAPLAATPGLPDGHTSIRVFAQTDQFAPTHHRVDLLVPIGSLSGAVDILGEVVAAGGNTPVNNVRDRVVATPRNWQASFMLDPASYICHVILRERSTGRTYGETISFTVN